MRVYREMLIKDSRRMRDIVEGKVMLEITIEPRTRLAHRLLRNAQIPAECLVVSIRREGELLFPRSGTTIKAGDVVTFLVSPRGEERLQQYLVERVTREESLATTLWA